MATATEKVILDPRLTVAENHAKAFCERIDPHVKGTTDEVLTLAAVTDIFQQAINDARFMSGQH